MEIGDGATINWYTDRTACTIIGISKSKRQITIQVDESTLDENWKPEWCEGGFAGHCINNGSQVYNYKSNPDGAIHKVSLRKNGRWVLAGSNAKTGLSVTIGVRRTFHDYNF